jgi:hypothetical protein
LIIALLFGGFTVASAAEANAWIVRRVAPIRRIAPVRRVAARAVLPPYPVARRVIAGPVIRRRPVVYASPVVYPAPVVYGPTVSVGVGVGGYYGW